MKREPAKLHSGANPLAKADSVFRKSPKAQKVMSICEKLKSALRSSNLRRNLSFAIPSFNSTLYKVELKKDFFGKDLLKKRGIRYVLAFF